MEKHGEVAKPMNLIFYRDFVNEDDLEEVRLIYY
jgi:hypothetical protein